MVLLNGVICIVSYRRLVPSKNRQVLKDST